MFICSRSQAGLQLPCPLELTRQCWLTDAPVDMTFSASVTPGDTSEYSNHHSLPACRSCSLSWCFPHRRDALVVCQVAQWYADRAIQIDARSGLLDCATALLEAAVAAGITAPSAVGSSASPAAQYLLQVLRLAHALAGMSRSSAAVADSGIFLRVGSRTTHAWHTSSA